MGLSSAMRGPKSVAPLAGLVIAACLAGLVAVLLYYADAKARLEAADKLHAALGDVRIEIDRRLEASLIVPETLAVVIASTDGIEDPAFRAIGARLVRAKPDIRNLAIAPDNVVSQVYPLQGNAPALGLVYADNPDQYPGVLRAMQTRSTIVVGPIDLVQGGVGVISRTPVFLSSSDDIETRYWGVVSLVVDVGEMFTSIEDIARRHGVELAVRQANPGEPPKQAFHGGQATFADAPVLAYHPLPGGARWEIAAHPAGGWNSVASAPLAARIALYLLALLVGWWVYRYLARHHQERMLASRDALTGLLNRKAFDQHMQEALTGAAPGQALVVLDLDDFKPVNDTYGHGIGDQVLAQAARRLQQAMPDPDAVFRIGGDEFAVVLQGQPDVGKVIRMAEQAAERVAAPVSIDGAHSVQVGVSAGVSPFPLPGLAERVSDVFDRADRALYRGKALGSGQVQAEPASLAGTGNG